MRRAFFFVYHPFFDIVSHPTKEAKTPFFLFFFAFFSLLKQPKCFFFLNSRRKEKKKNYYPLLFFFLLFHRVYVLKGYCLSFFDLHSFQVRDALLFFLHLVSFFYFSFRNPLFSFWYTHTHTDSSSHSKESASRSVFPFIS